MNFQQFQTEVKKHLILKDPYILKLITAASIASYSEQFDPVWIVLIGSSGGGKSEITAPMAGLPYLYELDDLTPNTLISGMKTAKGAPTSLLERWKIDRIKQILTKDLTTFLSKDSKDIKSILGQLRQAYDGRLSKEFGNSSTGITVELKFGWIACCTSMWYEATKEFGSLGERFICYEMALPDQSEVGKLIMKRKDKNWRQNLNNVYKQYFTDVLLKCKGKVDMDDFPLEIETKLIQLADLVTFSRTSVQRNGYKQEIHTTHLREAIGRLLTVITILARSLGYINKIDTGSKELTTIDMDLLARLCLTAIPQARRTALFSLARYSGHATFNEISTSGKATKEALDELAAIGIIRRELGFNNKQTWYMDKKYVDILNGWRHVMGDTLVELYSEDDNISTLEEPTDLGLVSQF